MGGMDLFTLSDLSTPWSVHVAATLRIADHIADGHDEIGALAAVAGADRNSLHRMLRHLVSKGLFTEPSPGHFALNDLARGLLGESGRIALDLDSFGGRMAHAWGTLLAAVRTGKPAYHEAFGRPFWDDLEAHPELAEKFDALMGPAGHGAPDPEVLIDSADWQSIRAVVDVGGGSGYLLAEILRAHPALRGTLVDLPRTVTRAAQVLQSAGVADRAAVVGQSFFDPLPAGADLYILKNVLADWPDAEATTILRRCAEAARPHGRVVAFTGVVPGEEASPELLMMILVGGRGRTLDEFRAMAREAGLEMTASGRQPTGRAIAEFHPL